MKPTIYRESLRTAGTCHRCYECGTRIRTRTRYLHISGIWDGMWDDFRLCLYCDWLRYQMQDFIPPEEMAFGELHEDARELYIHSTDFLPPLEKGSTATC